MIHVRIELWPGGDKRRAKLLGAMNIANDGTGNEAVGNYNVVAWGEAHQEFPFGRPTVTRAPLFERSGGFWRLVRYALERLEAAR